MTEWHSRLPIGVLATSANARDMYMQAFLRASLQPGTDEDVAQREPFVINLTDTRCQSETTQFVG